jgi:hypothetical protein
MFLLVPGSSIWRFEESGYIVFVKLQRSRGSTGVITCKLYVCVTGPLKRLVIFGEMGFLCFLPLRHIELFPVVGSFSCPCLLPFVVFLPLDTLRAVWTAWDKGSPLLKIPSSSSLCPLNAGSVLVVLVPLLGEMPRQGRPRDCIGAESSP